MTQYAVYTMRRTATRTVYAIYDELAGQPVCKEGTNAPETFSDRRAAQMRAFELAKAGRS